MEHGAIHQLVIIKQNKEDRNMENTNRAEVTSAQSREDWLIGRLGNI